MVLEKWGGVLVGFWFRETSLYLILWQPLIFSQKGTKNRPILFCRVNLILQKVIFGK